MLKVIKVSVLAVLILLAYSQPTMAREFADIYTECGLGALIAPRNTVVAAITNITWDLGTTAISSNISSPASCKGGQAKTAAFINDSYKSLEKDLASGNGTYINTLMAMTGCNPQVHQELINAVRNDFTNIVANPGYTNQSHFEQAKNLYDLLYKNIDENFSGTCSENTV